MDGSRGTAGLSHSNVQKTTIFKKMEVIKVPDKRQNREKWPAAIFVNTLLVIVVGVHLHLFDEKCAFVRAITSKKMEELDARFLIDILATMLLGHLIAEILRRLCLFWEEWYHLDTRYQKSKKLALLTSISFDRRSIIMTGVIVLICLIIISSGSYGFHFLILIPFYSIIYLFLHIGGIWRPRETDLQKLGDSLVNFGNAFAWQYYFGYLKIVLPDLLKRVAEFEQQEKVSIIVHKLFILLPESCYIPSLLSSHEADVNILEFVNNLKEISIDRNGAKGRIYKNPVYRVHLKGDQPFYCCVESAAILNSLNDMSEKEKLTGVTDQKKSEQLRNFCCSLQNILDEDNEGLGKLVQLVYYNDLDADGNQVKISDVLKHQIGVALRQDMS